MRSAVSVRFWKTKGFCGWLVPLIQLAYRAVR